MPRNQPTTCSETSNTAPQEDVQRLENQVGQLIRMIANLNERLHMLETIQSATKKDLHSCKMQVQSVK